MNVVHRGMSGSNMRGIMKCGFDFGPPNGSRGALEYPQHRGSDSHWYECGSFASIASDEKACPGCWPEYKDRHIIRLHINRGRVYHEHR